MSAHFPQKSLLGKKETVAPTAGQRWPWALLLGNSGNLFIPDPHQKTDVYFLPLGLPDTLTLLLFNRCFHTYDVWFLVCWHTLASLLTQVDPTSFLTHNHPYMHPETATKMQSLVKRFSRFFLCLNVVFLTQSYLSLVLKTSKISILRTLAAQHSYLGYLPLFVF